MTSEGDSDYSCAYSSDPPTVDRLLNLIGSLQMEAVGEKQVMMAPFSMALERMVS